MASRAKDKVLAFLLVQTAITDLTTDERIWAGYREPPESAGYAPDQGPAIVFANDGGQGNYNHGVASPRFMFRLYGCDIVEANRLYEAMEPLLFERSNMALRAQHGIFNAVLESGPVDQFGTETDWPHVLFFMRCRVKL